MKLNGWVWLIIGLIVSGFSMYVEHLNSESNLIIFRYLGFLFIVIGIFKVLVGFITKPKHERKPNNESNIESTVEKTVVKDKGKFFNFLGNDLAKVKLDANLETEKRKIQEQIKMNSKMREKFVHDKLQNQNISQKNQVKSSAFCPFCSSKISDNMAFCYNCGSKLR
ncbi:zinc ribbon domain-containing protein [Candidatus Woesearchaeota archaeon]|nr:zinc ribbon domain-containing protein [Candidatus Woesearchaeota archaeon]